MGPRLIRSKILEASCDKGYLDDREEWLDVLFAPVFPRFEPQRPGHVAIRVLKEEQDIAFPTLPLGDAAIAVGEAGELYAADWAN